MKKPEGDLVQELKALLIRNKSKQYYANKLDITVERIDELLDIIRGKNSTSEFSREIDNIKGIVKSVVTSTFEPKDDVELAKLHKIDLDKYIISNYYSKLQTSGKFTSTLNCRLKKSEDYSLADFEKFLNRYTPPTIKVKTYTSGNVKETIDIEISLDDFHLGKKTLEGETLLDKVVQYLAVVADLLDKVRSNYNINKIIFPISNDFFHTDNYQNQTTNGTPQDVLVSYDEEYETGFDLLVKAISLLEHNAKEVEVILVQGNHDRTKSFYFAHGLAIFFNNKKNITFQREHSVTKFTTVGNTFIGYHHGNCKIDDLPLIFATSEKSAPFFGNAKYREVHTGDKHHYMAKEVKGVRIQQMPSLSGTDRWHLDNNYINNVRAGLVLLYHPIYGKIGEFESRI